MYAELDMSRRSGHFSKSLHNSKSDIQFTKLSQVYHGWSHTPGKTEERFLKYAIHFREPRVFSLCSFYFRRTLL